MTVLIHVLGSDTPHHNRTVLRFFNDALTVTSGYAREFMVAGGDGGSNGSCPVLSVQFSPGKKPLVEAVIARAKADHQQRFFLHGQLNPKLWLALPNGDIRPGQFFWHIWRTDLYEFSSGLRYKFFYPLRRLAQKRVGCTSATRDDLSFFAKTHPEVRGELLYFPARMDPSLNMMVNDRQHERKMTILVGNSDDYNNGHTTILRAVYQQFGDTIKVVVPMGYPPSNETYIEGVRQAGLELFSEENLQVLSEKLGFDAYLALLRQCNLGYFVFACQQGIGMLCLLVQADIPCMLNRENPFWQDMTEQRLPILFAADDLSEDIVREARRQLALVDRNTIALSSPSYLRGWQWVLAITAEEIA